MNQEFKNNLDRMLDGNYSAKDPQPEQEYSGFYNARDISFIQPNGDTYTFYYPYLVHCMFGKEDGKISLYFTSHIVLLNGVHLYPLAVDLARHRIKEVSCQQARYNVLNETNEPVVNEITITEK